MNFEPARAPLGRATLLFFVPWLAHCGGNPTAASAAHAEVTEPSTEHTSSGQSKGDASPEPEATVRENCAETGCFTCGAGTCPRGSYCDETNSDQAACAWLGDCGEVPTCACLTRILGPGCSCEESEGNARIRGGG